jgi:choloylglycine hydrolase
MRKIFVIFAGFWALMSQVDACTAFQLKATDGSWIYCRSMEFGINMDSDFLIVPQGMDYTGTAPQGKAGLKWKTKYGFAGLNQRLEPTFISDGMNEKGLVASILYLPHFAHYEAPDSAKTDRTLGMWELPAFILGTCSTIDEVKAVLPTILVAQEPVPVLGNFILPLHLYVSDAAGKVLIVEYVKGERRSMTIP